MGVGVAQHGEREGVVEERVRLSDEALGILSNIVIQI